MAKLVTPALFQPSDRLDQIKGVLSFYGYLIGGSSSMAQTVLVDHIVSCLRTVAIEIFMTEPQGCVGYRAGVVRQALTEYEKTGTIDLSGGVYEHS